MNEERELVKEYSVDDQGIKNIVSEIFASDDNDLRDYLTRITDLLENIELKRINILINYLLYGLILNDAAAFTCLDGAREEIGAYMDGYLAGLNAVDTALNESNVISVDAFPALVDQLRTDKDYYKNNRKEIDRLLKLLPDVKGNLDHILKLIIVPEL